MKTKLKDFKRVKKANEKGYVRVKKKRERRGSMWGRDEIRVSILATSASR
jgi:hypothetical protein